MLIKDAKGDFIEVCRECRKTAAEHPFRMACPPISYDEFEITAFGQEGEVERVWTRATYNAATYIAESAVHRAGHLRAVVINTYGGIRSDVLYEVTPTSTRDFVAEDCKK